MTVRWRFSTLKIFRFAQVLEIKQLWLMNQSCRWDKCANGEGDWVNHVAGDYTQVSFPLSWIFEHLCRRWTAYQEGRHERQLLLTAHHHAEVLLSLQKSHSSKAHLLFIVNRDGSHCWRYAGRLCGLFPQGQRTCEEASYPFWACYLLLIDLCLHLVLHFCPLVKEILSFLFLLFKCLFPSLLTT